jgi:hypothetical protein
MLAVFNSIEKRDLFVGTAQQGQRYDQDLARFVNLR